VTVLGSYIWGVSNRFGYRVFHILYAAILYPSALWLPLTFGALAQTSVILLWLVRIVLIVVGAASVGLLIVLLISKPAQPIRCIGWR
jgi:hypothetical protein